MPGLVATTEHALTAVELNLLVEVILQPVPVTEKVTSPFPVPPVAERVTVAPTRALEAEAFATSFAWGLPRKVKTTAAEFAMRNVPLAALVATTEHVPGAESESLLMEPDVVILQPVPVALKVTLPVPEPPV